MDAARDDGWSRLSLALVSVISLVVGAFVGGLATFTHRQWRIPLGAIQPPLGILVGVVLIGALVAGLRLAFPRPAAIGGAIGAVAAIGLLALPAPGGSALVVGDPIGWTWAILPAVVSAVILVWPSRWPGRPASSV